MEFEGLLTGTPVVTPPTTDRVRSHTASAVNQKIDQITMKRIWFYATQSKELVTQRIEQLDREWDIERLIETKSAVVALSGLVLGVTARRKRWLILPAFVLGSLLQHALVGSSLPMHALRRMGVRTRREIDAEKYALRMLRGDFDGLKTISEGTHRAIEALRLSRM